MDKIIHNKTEKGGAFEYYTEEEKRAQMVYLNAGDNKLVIEHTDVDESLKGKGIGKKLLGELVSYVRENKIQVIPLCPFAKATFEKTHEWQDVLAHVRVKLKE